MPHLVARVNSSAKSRPAVLSGELFVEAYIYKAVCSVLYKCALGQNRQPCAAFILGSKEGSAAPRFEFALIAVAAASWNALTVESLVVGLDQHLACGRQVAKDFQREVLGVGIAWDSDFPRYAGNRHAQFGLLIDFADQHQIRYVLEVPIDGGESMWGLGVYFVPRFPDNSLSYKMVYQRPKTALDNPRRIKRAWQQAMQ